MISLREEEDAFLTWFAETSAQDAAMVWAKAKDYGSFDETARAAAAAFGWPPERLASLDHERVVAINCAQKLGRILAALGRGEKPSDDCWRDLACYAMVARRLREVGTWPA